MKMNKEEMKKVLGGGTLDKECMTVCWDGSIIKIPCQSPINLHCRSTPSSVSCGNIMMHCPPQN